MRVRTFIGAALTALVAAGTIGAVAAPAHAAGPRPLFQMPFPCGEQWRMATYAGHDDYEIDMTRPDWNSLGRPIVASYAGTVIASGYSGGAGNRVRIQHEGNWQTEYYHMVTTPIVSVGQQVAQGQVLGYVGSTGDSSGPHLHYAQRIDGTPSSMGTVVQSYFDGLPVDITDDARANSFFLTSNNCGAMAKTPITTVAQANGTVDVFWRDTGGGISHRWYAYGTWYGPESMNVGIVASEPVVTTTANGELYLFWKGTDGNLWLKHFNNGWQPHVNLGSGPLGGGPVAVGQTNGTVDVFWKGTDGGLWHKWLAYGTWYGPENMNVGTLGSDPQVTAIPNGGLEVVWKGTNGSLWHKAFDNGWQPHVNLGGAMDSGPKVVGHANGVVDVFWKGSDGALWTVRKDGAWAYPGSLGAAPLGSEPTAVATANGGLEVLWKGTDNALWHKTFTGTSWQGHASLGSGPLGSAPFAAGQPGGTVDVFWKGTNGSLWHKWLAYGTWYGPENMGGAIS